MATVKVIAMDLVKDLVTDMQLTYHKVLGVQGCCLKGLYGPLCRRGW